MNRICIDRSGSLEGFSRIIAELQDGSLPNPVEGILILSCEANGFADGAAQTKLGDILRNISVPVFGGVFPAILVGGESLNRGTVVASFTRQPRVQIIACPADGDAGFNLDDTLVTDDTQTLMILVDWLLPNITDLLDAVFDIYGSELKYLGGGAGSVATMKPMPCLFTNDGLIQHSALLVAFDNPSHIGASHGLDAVSGPHVITHAQGGTVHTLDLKPIYPFFQKIANDRLDAKQDDDFPLVSKHFSLGLSRLGEEMVIREPATVVADQAMTFGTRMIEGELLYVMKAEPEAILNALQQTSDCLNLNPVPNGLTLVFDCISRQWFFGERYGELLEILDTADRPLIGAQTIGGEIACNGDGYLEYLNRTCVVGYIET